MGNRTGRHGGAHCLAWNKVDSVNEVTIVTISILAYHPFSLTELNYSQWIPRLTRDGYWIEATSGSPYSMW